MRSDRPFREPSTGLRLRTLRRSKPTAIPSRTSDTIGLIEVMKTFQEIPAGLDGKNITFLVENEEPVMAGQVIAEVEP